MHDGFVVISQFDGDVNFLRLNLSEGSAEVVSSDKIGKDNVSFGMFEFERGESRNDYVALIATPEGPLMFLNGLRYSPHIDQTDVKISDDGEFSHFLVLHDQAPIFGLFYKKKFGIGLHPYLHSREDFDFYYWLSKNIKNPKLYESYKKEKNLSG